MVIVMYPNVTTCPTTKGQRANKLHLFIGKQYPIYLCIAKTLSY